ncbi:MAG: RHS repeat-associated core domain-containing protein [Luteibacter sp.]|jgi:RHS repeat-associated protein|nr:MULTISPECIES: RHS repeat-associated core domain-containing protein [unclassified Luteibacter]MDQ7994264.1 RHS repeat-associated core domain-containing protein [Luteibacter sp.]MDQ8048564.1 RHS repeat-associated core domain-containing protein [Luteibacter sp.]
MYADGSDAPRAVTNATGQLVWSWPLQSNAFDEASPIGTLTLNLRFAGQYADAESGLVYNGHRYYEPSTGAMSKATPWVWPRAVRHVWYQGFWDHIWKCGR